MEISKHMYTQLTFELGKNKTKIFKEFIGIYMELKYPKMTLQKVLRVHNSRQSDFDTVTM